MIALDVEGLRFQYPGGFRLDVDELSLDESERLAVVAPNGAGKTTLLRLLALLERPAGFSRFRCCGHDMGRKPRRLREVGLMRQEPWIFRTSVRDNLGFGLRARGLSGRKLREPVEAMADRLGLAGRLAAPARSLSGGERKLLALGRVLLAAPRVLLLDEPTAHLDRSSRALTEDLLLAASASLLVTTHDLAFAHRLAHRTMTIENGRLLRGTGAIVRMPTQAPDMKEERFA